MKSFGFGVNVGVSPITRSTPFIPLLDSLVHQASNEKGAAPTDPAITLRRDCRSRR